MSFMLFCSDIIFLVCSQFIKLWPIIKFCELRIILSVKHKWRDVLKVYFIFLIKKIQRCIPKNKRQKVLPIKRISQTRLKEHFTKFVKQIRYNLNNIALHVVYKLSICSIQKVYSKIKEEIVFTFFCLMNNGGLSFSKK